MAGLYVHVSDRGSFEDSHAHALGPDSAASLSVNASSPGSVEG